MVNLRNNPTVSILLTASRQFYIQQCKYHASSNKGSYLHHVGKNPMLYKTIGDLVDEAAKRYPDRNAYVLCEENKRITFKELKEQTDNLAAGLLTLGFKKEDKVALWGPNTLDWLISFFATAKIGVISVLMNPVYQIPELKYSLKKAHVSGIITPKSFRAHNYFEMINELFPNLKNSSKEDLESFTSQSLPRVILSSENKLHGAFQFKNILEVGNTCKLEILNTARDKVSPDDGFCIQFSSGTTGKPKAALLSHNNYVNNSYPVTERLELYDEHHKICLQSPFFHVLATDVIICPALFSGSTVVVPSKSYNPLKTLKTIETEKCTYLNGTPTMFVDVIKLQKEHNFDLSSLKYTITGGAPCPPVLFQDKLKTLQVKKVKSIYGMTETTAVVFQSLPNESKMCATETVGHLADHVEAKVVDENGKLVPFGKPGELHIRGNCAMLEYYDDEEKTKETKGRDGWIKTGDQFVLYESGYGQIVGRLKDMIIRGGENIFPKEIEDFLNTHPKIVDSQVFGVPDERMGEEIMVCLRVIENSTITLNEIESYSVGKLAKFKIPKYLRIVEDYPRTLSGKVQKHKLREMIVKEFNEELHLKSSVASGL
ncbi:medium-chain acyl-CoA ligase ACSF2, mitochondrial-like [Chrysoperla carnea]|uniref:medium-chain acyl-CoA ligase ACSF2, mitochondrial-like n=1 Tax=Chrysoperla carnea TaxID=189513 RepID=UPI001D08FBC9|nr:medium-chain acyl-CoA ligase ACSF2, mitochondrial-like [Chrysoperla carnea]